MKKNKEIFYYPNPQQKLAADKAFKALYAYEKNCKAKYDYPDNRPSKPIPRGERMGDYAMIYGTTIKEMKYFEEKVDRLLCQ